MTDEREGVKVGTLCKECQIFLGPPTGYDRMCQKCYEKAIKEFQQDIEHYFDKYL